MRWTIAEIKQHSENTQPISAEEASAITEGYPYLPEEYLKILSEVGAGEICGLMFYSVPLELDEIFDEAEVQKSPEIILIADDCAGGHLGYMQGEESWVLTFFDHMDLPDVEPSSQSTLAEFLAWWAE